VLVVDSDGKIARKNVTTDVARAGSWIVTGGLAAGDQVIVSGIQRAKPGSPAKATPWQPTAPTASPGNATNAPADAKSAPPNDKKPDAPAQQPDKK
jgi:membrane fusion protein (multidrug efflux system)